jgi:hypothetical protein
MELQIWTLPAGYKVRFGYVLFAREAFSRREIWRTVEGAREIEETLIAIIRLCDF